MPRIIITDECRKAIRANARGNAFRETGIRSHDDCWSIPLDQEVYDRLHEMRMPGETLSDTIMRGLATANGSIQ